MDVYKLFIGDDTNGDFGRKFFFTPISDLDLTDCIAQFTVAGVTKTFTNLVSGEPQELVFTRAQTGSMKRGMYRATLAIYDSTGRHRTIANDILVKVTDVVEEVYSGVDNSMRFTVDSGVSWEGISNKPPLVTKTELGEALANIDIPDTASQRDVRQYLQSLVSALKGIAVCVAAMFCLTSFGLDDATEWQDVPPTNTVKGVVELFSHPADFSTNNTQLVETIEATSPTPDFTTNNTALVDTIDAVSPPPANYANVSNAAMNAASKVSPTITNMIRFEGHNAYWELFGGQTGWYFTVLNGNAYRIELNSDSYATSNDVGSASNVLLASRMWVDGYLAGKLKSDIPPAVSNIVTKSFVEDLGITSDESDPVWNAEKGDYATKAALESGTIKVNSAEYADNARDAYNAEYAVLAEGLRSSDSPKEVYADAIFAQLDAATETNAQQTAAIAAIQQDYLPLDYFKDGQTIPMYWGDGTKLCDFGANWLGNLENTVNEKLDSADIPPAVSNVVTTAYVREKLGVYLYVGEDGGIYVHTNED